MNHNATRRHSVLILHHDPLLSAGLVAALRDCGNFDVHLHGPDVMEPETARIDVIVADYPSAMHLAEEGARAAHQWNWASARVLALTSNDREADIRRAIEAGVHGYLLVGGPIGELIDGVKALAQGVRYLGPSVAQRMADSLTRTALTLREVEVLHLVAAGESNKAIARQLSIELGTVKSHMSAIMAKLGASSRTHAAIIAAKRGLVEERSRMPQPVLQAA